jgi:hypothetical protein
VELTQSFIPAADEVYRLQSGRDAECRLFQKFAEQGHYGGRTVPSNTRQGTYAVTPSGVFLASLNSNDPEAVAGMLRRALDKWKTLTREQRLSAESAAPAPADLSRAERFYPADGLALQVHSRDLPREGAAAQQAAQPASQERGAWRGQAWNNDFAWFTKAEARSFLPDTVTVGGRREVPEALVRRVVRLHIVDNVRGQTEGFADRDVEKARLSTTVESVAGDLATLKLEGETRTHVEGVWSIAGYRDMGRPTPQERGIETKLFGRAKYDLKKERFTAFEMVAVGNRWGATQYNGRTNDRDLAPIGFAFTLAGDRPAERVAPAHFQAYGWR